MTRRVTEGARRDRHEKRETTRKTRENGLSFFFSGCHPRFSRLAVSLLDARLHVHYPVTKSEEKGRLLAVQTQPAQLARLQRAAKCCRFLIGGGAARSLGGFGLRLRQHLSPESTRARSREPNSIGQASPGQGNMPSLNFTYSTTFKRKIYTIQGLEQGVFFDR